MFITIIILLSNSATIEDKIPSEAYKHCEGQHQVCGAAVPDTTKRWHRAVGNGWMRSQAEDSGLTNNHAYLTLDLSVKHGEPPFLDSTWFNHIQRAAMVVQDSLYMFI